MCLGLVGSLRSGMWGCGAWGLGGRVEGLGPVRFGRAFLVETFLLQVTPFVKKQWPSKTN